MRVLSRAWQMLFKGIAEVQAANRPIAAAEMVLVRLAYAADLPTPDEAIRMLDGQGTVAGAPGNGVAAPAGGAGNGARSATAALSSRQDGPRQSGLRQDVLLQDPPRGAARASLASALPSSALASGKPMPQEAGASVLTIDTFEQMVALAAERRDLQIKAALERDVRLVRCEDGTLEIALEPGAPRTLVNDLSRKLQQWTGRRWMVIVSGEQGAATLRSQADARQAELEVGVRADPLVRAVLTRFPGAEIVGVRGQSEIMPDVPAFVAQDGVPPADDDGGFGDNWVRDDGND
jgi:DNA polymerase-3 subunit gamma/tau